MGSGYELFWRRGLNLPLGTAKGIRPERAGGRPNGLVPAFLMTLAFLGSIALPSFVPLDVLPVSPVLGPGEPGDDLQARVDAAYGDLPLSFETNRGQTDPQVKFLARGPGYTLFLTPSEAVLWLQSPEESEEKELVRPEDPDSTPLGSVLRIQFAGSNIAARVSGEHALEGKVNYFIGNDPTQWRTEIPTYARVVYREVYPGVDLEFYGVQGQVEYDFIVAPRANPETITLRYVGAQDIEVDAFGHLNLLLETGELRQKRPIVYQEEDGVRTEVAGGYCITESIEVRFALAAYDRSRPLVIDPILLYSTYLGGSNVDQGSDIAVDAALSAYVTGTTSSLDFPTSLGAWDTTLTVGPDAFVTKLNLAGTALVYSTYLGGSGGDVGSGIAVDAALSVYVTGSTGSSNFPTTPGAFDTTLSGSDAFVTKLNLAGTALDYSTYLGGSGTDQGSDIAVDTALSAYVTGATSSANFPTSLGAWDTTLTVGPDVFVTKLGLAGTALVYSTYLGGSSADRGNGIAVDAALSAYVTGLTFSANFPATSGAFDTTFNGVLDAFITKLNPAGTALVYSTYLGGSRNDQGNGIAVDAVLSAYVTGLTLSGDFPTTLGAFDTSFNSASDAFVTKLNPAGTALVYSTYLGSSGSDVGGGIAIDTALSAYVTGATDSGNFPTTPGAFDTTFNSASDAFVTKLNPAGTVLVYSTYLGGSGTDQGIDIAVDAAFSAYVTGTTSSPNFPTTLGAFDTTFNGGPIGDAFVTKLMPPGPPATLTLAPRMGANTVGTTHCVTATVQDVSGTPVPGVTVRFSVPTSLATHSNPSSGSDVTDSNGAATFCYTASLPGQDTIHAFADSDDDGTQDGGEPFDDAAKTWTPPANTAFCEVKITQGGWIIADNGDRANFGGNAKVSKDGTTVTGEEEYKDQGPADPMNVHSIELTAATCSSDLTMATIFGTATIDGSGTFVFRIDVIDNGEPGTNDAYGIILSNGYVSGQHRLQGGNVKIHKS